MIKHIIKKARQNALTKKIGTLLDPTSSRIEKFASSLAAALPQGSRILDAGAGEIPFKKYFSKQQYIAVDTQWGDLEWDYSKLDTVANLTSLPFQNEKIDGILCTQVLEHVNEPFLIFSEFYRVLKPGGLVYLSAPQGWGVHQAPHDYFRYTKYGLIYLLEKAGFKINTVKQTCGYFGYLANRLTVFPKAMFWQIRSKILRLLLSPLELLSYFLFVLIFPLLLNAIDFLDSKQDYTLNYMITAAKDE
ncbi:MAG: class I SAM-dependent methyltransferase [bacterium]|nr:class I SAM-dependent methyltransferase [bacterium]